MEYAVCEISGRQYLVKPGDIVEVDKLAADAKSFLVDKVLLISGKDEIKIGMPYLKETLDFEVIGHIKKPKIRVATYKAKANYRRTKGQRRVMTKVKLIEKESVKKS